MGKVHIASYIKYIIHLILYLWWILLHDQGNNLFRFIFDMTTHLHNKRKLL